MYIDDMTTFEMIWRGSILALLAYLSWSSFVAGGILGGLFLLVCIPVWLYIVLYNHGYF